MNRIIAVLSTFSIAWNAHAHPGHPTFDPNHAHGRFELDPMLGLALLAVAVGIAAVGRSVLRGRGKR